MENPRILCLEENPEGMEPSVSRQLKSLDSSCIPFHSPGEGLPWDLVYCSWNSHNLGILMKDVLDPPGTSGYDILFIEILPGTPASELKDIKEILSQASVLKISEDDLSGLSSRFFGRSLNRKDFFHNLIYLFSVELLIVTNPVSGADFFYRAMPDEILSASSKGTGAGKKWESSFTGAFIYFFLRGERLYKAAENAVALADYTAGIHSLLPELDSGIRQQLGLSIAG